MIGAENRPSIRGVESRLALVIVAVESLARSVELYTRAFGWTKTVDTPVYVELAVPGGMRLGLYDRQGFARNIGELPAPSPSTVTSTELYVYVEDLEASFERVLSAGGRVLSPIARRGWGDIVGYLADPDGNVLALAQRGS